MADGRGAGASRRRQAKKTTGAFGKLNALSTSGALTAINQSPAPEDVATPTPQPSTTPKLSAAPAPATEVLAPTAEQPAEGTSAAASPAPAPEAIAPTNEGPADAVAPRVPAPSTEVVGEPGNLVAPSSNVPAVAMPEAPAGVPEEAPSARPSSDSALLSSGSAAKGPHEAVKSALVVSDAPDGEERVRGEHPVPNEKATTHVGSVTVRKSAPPALPMTSGYSEQRMLEALPPQLAHKVEGLPVAYLELAKSYRRAQATRTGTKPAKRNIRLHTEVATAMNHQMVADKRRLGLRNLKPSQYVDAALTLARGVSVEDLIRAADGFRDKHIGEDSGFGSPNHYSIWKENDDWLDEMMDELLLANTTGLHGHMINVIVESFLQQLNAEAPAES